MKDQRHQIVVQSHLQVVPPLIRVVEVKVTKRVNLISYLLLKIDTVLIEIGLCIICELVIFCV